MALADLFTSDTPGLTIRAEPEIREAIARLEVFLRGERALAPPAVPADPFDVLRHAMENKQVVSFTYRRGYDGAQGRYVGEPYEMGTHPISGRPVLWVIPYSGSGAIPMHEHGGEIHAFRDDRVLWNTMTLLEEPFTPVWPVQSESVG